MANFGIIVRLSIIVTYGVVKGLILDYNSDIKNPICLIGNYLIPLL